MKIFKSITKRIFTFMLLLLLCLSVQAQTEHNWIRTNPGGGGAFFCIKAGPTGTIIAGGDLSGAYISKDKGVSFTCIGALQGLADTHVMSIGFDPIDPNKFFIGTASFLQMTTDGGLTFSTSLIPGCSSDIVISKSNPLLVYAAVHSAWNSTDGAIYRSTDGGSTFSNMSGSTGTRMLKLILDPTNNQIIYYVTGSMSGASTPPRLYRSVDGGVTSSEISGGRDVMDADIDPVTTSTIYMTTCSTWTDGDFYKSTDNGSTWSSPIAHPGGIFVKKDEPNRIRVIDSRGTALWNGGSGTWESTDNGTTWDKTGIVVSQAWEAGYNKDVMLMSSFETSNSWDVFRSYGGSVAGIAKCFGTDMSDPNVILWCNSQFLFRSSDGGVTFKNIFTNEVSPGWWQSRGVDNVNMMDMAISEANPKTIYAGYFDIGFWRSLDGGISWQSSNAGTLINSNPPVYYSGAWAGYGGNVASIAADPTRAAVVWTTMSGNQAGQSPTYLLKSTSSGSRGSWTLANQGLPTIEVMGISIDRTSSATSRTMYVTAQGYVYKSINDGANWTKLTTGLPTGGLRFTAVDNFDGNIVYAGGGTGLYTSTDAGANWSSVGMMDLSSRGGTVDFWGSGGKGVFDIEPDPQTGGTVYVTVYGLAKGLYRGVKSGATWTWTKLCTDNYMRKVYVNPLNNNYVYATASSAFTSGNYDSSSHGVLFSNDKFATHSLVNNGMAWTFAMTVKCDKLNNVYVGSPGTGFQKSAMPLSTGIEDLTNEGNILIYPNPTNDYININIPKITGEYMIEIRNMLGQKVLSYSKLTPQIDVSTLKNGVYVLSIIGYNINYSHKFIKQ